MLMAIFLVSLLAVGVVSAADDTAGDFVSMDDASNVAGDDSSIGLDFSDTNYKTADEISSTQPNPAINGNGDDGFKESIGTNPDVDQTDSDSKFNKSSSECCSFVIQEENETVFAFRRDSAAVDSGVVVHNDSFDGLEVIVQEIGDFDNHFIHAIITEDGWIASHGGDSTNVSDTRALEQLAVEMLVSKNISSDSLAKIQKSFNEYYEGYGHFFIKASDGRYGAVFGETCVYGTLKPGEFLIIPNVYYGFRKGNYSDYGINPVDAIIEICSYENTGWSRRNIHSYDYKAHDTANGQKYGVDIYVTNDNGLNVGLNTSKFENYLEFNNEHYSPSVIPQNPDKLYIATYIFENQSIDSVFEVVSSPKNVLVNGNSFIHYRINNIDDEKTIIFNLDENVEFINALVSQGNYHYDSAQHKIFWDLSATNSSKEIMMNVRPKAKGVYKIHSHVEGIDEDFDVTFYATDSGVVLKANNVTTYKTYFKSFDVYLTDGDGVPLIGEKVSIMINGSVYYREVTPKGYAPLYIMLQPGEYEAIVSYYGDFGINQTTAKIIVKKTLFSEDLVVSHEDAKTFDIYCTDENGIDLQKSAVDFRIDGVLKTRYTDVQGICRFDISDLAIGNHTITSFNGRTNEIVTNSISIVNITKTELIVSAVTATYNIKKDLVISLKDSSESAVPHVKVSVKVGTISKTLTTNSKGQVSIDISSLVPKTYTATVKFSGGPNYKASSKSVNVIVKKSKTRLVALAKAFKVKATKKVTAILKDSKSRIIKNRYVTFKVAGKTYRVKTNSKGVATAIVKLAEKGSFGVSINFAGDKCYNKCSRATKLTIK